MLHFTARTITKIDSKWKWNRKIWQNDYNEVTLIRINCGKLIRLIELLFFIVRRNITTIGVRYTHQHSDAHVCSMCLYKFLCEWAVSGRMQCEYKRLYFAQSRTCLRKSMFTVWRKSSICWFVCLSLFYLDLETFIAISLSFNLTFFTRVFISIKHKSIENKRNRRTWTERVKACATWSTIAKCGKKSCAPHNIFAHSAFNDDDFFAFCFLPQMTNSPLAESHFFIKFKLTTWFWK